MGRRGRRRLSHSVGALKSQEPRGSGERSSSSPVAGVLWGQGPRSARERSDPFHSSFVTMEAIEVSLSIPPRLRQRSPPLGCLAARAASVVAL
jgi:hypothetical protein